MRIGFIYFAGFDVKAAADKAASERTGVEIVPVQAPSILQVPMTCKKVFAEFSLDCAVAFVQAEPDQTSELDLLHEKLVDVELTQIKYIFPVILLNDEWRSEEDRDEKAIHRINEALEKAAAFSSHSPTTPEMPDWMSGAPEQTHNEDDLGFMDDVGHKLF